MKLKTISLFSICLFFLFTCYGQGFSTYFENKTLRLDYIVGGNEENQNILFSKAVSFEGWSGRKSNLSDCFLRGNGQVKIYDSLTQQLIYTKSFSTLFQEWLSTDLSADISRGFENVVLTPYPKRTVSVEILLFDKNGKEMCKLSHFISPDDILIKNGRNNTATSYEYIYKSKSKGNTIDVAFVAEGYTEQEMDEFVNASKKAMHAIISHDPFSKYKDVFNFIVVKSTSKESGVTVPGENNWRNTLLNSHFNTFYEERYLTIPSLFDLHDVLIGLPYQHIIIIANTDRYGGGGIYNSYTISAADNTYFEPVTVHEFGHSFGGLADEYFYSDDALNEMIYKRNEPWEPNITTLVDFKNKWKFMLESSVSVPTSKKVEDGTVGVYEIHSGCGIYTGELNCRMKSNNTNKFCKVCQYYLEKLILFYTE